MRKNANYLHKWKGLLPGLRPTARSKNLSWHSWYFFFNFFSIEYKVKLSYTGFLISWEHDVLPNETAYCHEKVRFLLKKKTNRFHILYCQGTCKWPSHCERIFGFSKIYDYFPFIKWLIAGVILSKGLVRDGLEL